MQYEYFTHGTCSRLIILDIDGDILKNVTFIGGCNGNLQGISKLVSGMRCDDVVKQLKGINCGGKGTSCPDQLALAIEEAMARR